WIKLPRRGQVGGIVARMDNTNAYRGWDLWMEADKIGMHIVHKWPDNALKVTSKTPLQPGKWHHVLASYDGSGKAAGVRVYVNGVLQPLDVFTDRLRQTIRTKVPLTIGQRYRSERLPGTYIQDVRVYGRQLSGPEAEQLAKTPRAQELLAKPSDKRNPKETAELFDWWLPALDQPSRDLGNAIGQLAQEEVQLRSRGTIAHVMQERETEPVAYILHRG